MWSKYLWLITLADDESDLFQIWDLIAHDDELSFLQKFNLLEDLFLKFRKLKGR